jgi:hypothetical protein
LNARPFRRGDFVWCAFPQHEAPAQPGPRHLGYTVAVFGATSPGAGHDFSALVAYTTSQPWTQAVCPPGVFVFDRQTAVGFGQARAFVLDLRRLAFVPITPAWFPWLDQPGGDIQGRASAHWQQQLKQTAENLLTRRPEVIERLGPLWPGGRR